METKPFYLTSEFYVLIVTQVVSMLTLMGKLTPEQSDTITKATVTIAGAVVSIIGALGYTWNRTQIKRARADVLMMQMSKSPSNCSYDDKMINVRSIGL